MMTFQIDWNKIDIVQEAMRLQLPIHLTWSCYQGGTKECGVCDSCRIRNEALKKAGYSIRNNSH